MSDTVIQENTNLPWEEREKQLLANLDDYKKKFEGSQSKVTSLENELKSVSDERDNGKTQISKLEKDLAEALKLQVLPEAQEIINLKHHSEEMLTRAKGLIFEKTKICKNQELQIEALQQQVSSLKEVVAITKDLLDIRNVEVKHLQDRIECMESKVASEKERQELVHSKLERMVQMNADLKREYEAQLCLFNALRQKYSERELARNVLDELRTEVAQDAAAAAAAATGATPAATATPTATATTPAAAVATPTAAATTPTAAAAVASPTATLPTAATVDATALATPPADATPATDNATNEVQPAVNGSGDALPKAGENNSVA